MRLLAASGHAPAELLARALLRLDLQQPDERRLVLLVEWDHGDDAEVLVLASDDLLRFLAAVFLDYQVAGMPFDHGFVVGLFVSGDDQEPERVLPHRFEGSPVDLDRDHATGLLALAKERQQLTRVVNSFFEVCDVNVDLAEERFVTDGPLFRR